MRGLDRGESYIVVRNGVTVGELMTIRRYSAVDRPAARTGAFDGVA